MSVKDFEKLLTKKIYNKVREQADDFIVTTRDYDQIYENVPSNLVGVPIKVMEIHIYPDEYRKKIEAHQNDEPLVNSVQFINED